MVSERASELEGRVHAIFEAELPRPKRKFGYVLDLERLADTPNYVVKAKPEESEVYLVISNAARDHRNASVFVTLLVGALLVRLVGFSGGH